jgi:DNA polymerase III delta prime subunit
MLTLKPKAQSNHRMSRQTWKGSLLISGEPGTGKSRWIQDQAKGERAKLFRWNARIDRSLREGREVLHQQVRSKERLFVWIEGADDLTQEAQAFLRRILETSAPNVTCCLEVREIWKMSPPILSRCSIVTMRTESSYRTLRNVSLAKHLQIIPQQSEQAHIPTWDAIPELREKGADPYAILDSIIQEYGIQSTEVQECLRQIGAGSSPWIQLSYFLLKGASGKS